MYSMDRYLHSLRTWQDTWWAFGKVVVSVQEDMRQRALDAVLGRMQPDEVARLMLERPADFAGRWSAAAVRRSNSRRKAS